MTTSFSNVMKEIRDINNESLRTMAKRLGISAAFLSAIEVGKKTIPLDYADKISKEYKLSQQMHDKIVDAIYESNNMIKLSLDNLSEEQKELALLFSRKISNLDKDKIDIIKNALK